MCVESTRKCKDRPRALYRSRCLESLQAPAPSLEAGCRRMSYHHQVGQVGQVDQFDQAGHVGQVCHVGRVDQVGKVD